jgi:hypothetical protein
MPPTDSGVFLNLPMPSFACLRSTFVDGGEPAFASVNEMLSERILVGARGHVANLGPTLEFDGGQR